MRPKHTRQKQRTRDAELEHKHNQYVDSGLSRKILHLAREQQDEVELEAHLGGGARRRGRLSAGLESSNGSSGGSSNGFSATMRFSQMQEMGNDEDEDSDEEYRGDDSFGVEEYEEMDEVVWFPPPSG